MYGFFQFVLDAHKSKKNRVIYDIIISIFLLKDEVEIEQLLTNWDDTLSYANLSYECTMEEVIFYLTKTHDEKIIHTILTMKNSKPSWIEKVFKSLKEERDLDISKYYYALLESEEMTEEKVSLIYDYVELSKDEVILDKLLARTVSA